MSLARMSLLCISEERKTNEILFIRSKFKFSISWLQLDKSKLFWKIAVQTLVCVSAYFCKEHKNNFPLKFWSSFKYWNILLQVAFSVSVMQVSLSVLDAQVALSVTVMQMALSVLLFLFCSLLFLLKLYRGHFFPDSYCVILTHSITYCET